MTDDQTRSGSDSGPAADQTEARMREALGLTSNRGARDNRPKQSGSFNTSSPGRGGGGMDAPKRRFVRDGEVQVMMVSGTRATDTVQQRRGHGPGPGPGQMNEQAEASQATIRAERAAREKAERALKEAQDSVRDLQTKLGHIGMARDEAIEAARRADASRAALAQELATVMAQLSVEASARAHAERAHPERTQPLSAEPEPAPEPEAAGAPAPDAKRGRGRPRKVAAELVAAAPRVAVPKRKPGRPRVEKEPEPVKWWVPKRAKAKSPKLRPPA